MRLRVRGLTERRCRNHTCYAREKLDCFKQSSLQSYRAGYLEPTADGKIDNIQVSGNSRSCGWGLVSRPLLLRHIEDDFAADYRHYAACFENLRLRNFHDVCGEYGKISEF